MWLVEAGPFSRDDGVRWDPGTNVSKPPQPFRAIGDDAKEDFPSSARTTSEAALIHFAPCLATAEITPDWRFGQHGRAVVLIRRRGRPREKEP